MIYKSNSKDYIIRYQAWIIVYSNLQLEKLIILIYIIIFITWLFRITLALTVYFDLEIK